MVIVTYKMSLKLLRRVDRDLADLAPDFASGFVSGPEVGSGFFQLSERLLRLEFPGVTRTLDVVLEHRGRREGHLTDVTV